MEGLDRLRACLDEAPTGLDEKEHLRLSAHLPLPPVYARDGCGDVPARRELCIDEMAGDRPRDLRIRTRDEEDARTSRGHRGGKAGSP